MDPRIGIEPSAMIESEIRGEKGLVDARINERERLRREKTERREEKRHES